MAFDHFSGEGGQAIPAAALRLKVRSPVQTAAESGKPEITSERRIKGREFPLRISHKQEKANFSLSAAISPTAPGGAHHSLIHLRHQGYKLLYWGEKASCNCIR